MILDKKTILAVGLIFLVFLVSNEYLGPKEAKVEVKKDVPTESIIENELEKQNYSDSRQNEKQKLNNSKKELELKNDITLENDFASFVFSNKGAVLRAVYLKKYDQSKTNNSPVNIINGEALALSFDSDSYSDFIFEYVSTGRSLTFYGDGFEKIFTIGENYQIDLEIICSNRSFNYYEIDFGKGIADTEISTKSKVRDYGAVVYVNNSLEKEIFGKFDKEVKDFSGNIDMFAIYSKYFAIGGRKLDFIDVMDAKMYAYKASPTMSFRVREKRDEFTHRYKFYFGPIINEYLVGVGGGFEDISNRTWSILNNLSAIFVKFMKLIYSIIPNYGVAIIIFAFFIKIILYPLTHKMFESTQKMQLVQPLIAEVQKKYKNDKQRLNIEIKKVYKENGVNPLGGCLPLLLQIPVFFALYPALKFSIDLRQAAFGFWLHDLSAPDPYFILPVAMGVFMFVQQKITLNSSKSSCSMTDQQKAMQSSQKMMLYGMPIFMIFIFRDFPAGLVLYWTIFNVLSTLQQVIIKKKLSA